MDYGLSRNRRFLRVSKLRHGCAQSLRAPVADTLITGHFEAVGVTVKRSMDIKDSSSTPLENIRSNNVGGGCSDQGTGDAAAT
jgi:hypothetical protein